VHTTPYGTTAYASVYHPPTAYYGYHPPATVGYYQAGCYYCGYGAAAAAGAAVGAAIGTAGSIAAANANVSAYTTQYQMGATYAAVPAGCTMPQINGSIYYLCGDTWFSPAYGANGVTYRVIPAP